MKISLCLITKDEEHNIQRCLDSVEHLVDERIVVDTGSVDNTVVIAKNMGAKVYDFEWIDDFSAAKNAAIEKAIGDWIIFLDADEYLGDITRKQLEKVIHIAERCKADSIKCSLINLNDEGKFASVMKSIRIFKNIPEIRYKGCIHEFITHKNRDILCYEEENMITIFHIGYTKAEIQRKEKSERNLGLLYKELEKNPQDTQLHIYIGESLRIADRDAEALKHFQLAKAYWDGNHKPFMYQIFCNALACLSKNDEKSKINAWYSEAKLFDAVCPDFDFYMGYYCLQNKDYLLAIYHFETCLDNCQNYKYVFESRVISQIVAIYEQLLNLYALTKNNQGIVRIAMILLKNDPYHYKSLYMLLHTLKGKEDDEAIYSLLLKLYDMTSIKDKIYILKALESLEMNTLKQIVLSFMTEEERVKYEEGKKEGQKDVSALKEECKALNAVQCFEKARFYKDKNNLFKSMYFYQQAFQKDNELLKHILPIEHPFYEYKYEEIEEESIEQCPVCGGKSNIYKIGESFNHITFKKGYPPVKVWRECTHCTHVFASHYPKNYIDLTQEIEIKENISLNVGLLEEYDDILQLIRDYTKGYDFLQIGVGNGELLAKAQEYSYKIEAYDDRQQVCDNIQSLLGMNVQSKNMLEFNRDKKFDIICIEEDINRCLDPVAYFKELRELLNPKGVLWITVPNSKSAYATILKDNNIQFNRSEVIHYYSLKSLEYIIQNNGGHILKYKGSKLHPGYMEVLISFESLER